MDKKLDFSNLLDFSETDLTAPEKVVEGFISDLPSVTNDIISGKIEPYSGHVFSYTEQGIASMAIALGTKGKRVDIQDSLGASGETVNKFECYIYTPVYKYYKYRLFFMRYGVANYPVTLVLEESISRSISPSSSTYIYECENKNELEQLILDIFTSKRVIGVMQEIINIYQSKKDEPQGESEQDEREDE